MKNPSPILYTKTDEAPALATRSLLPILRAFAAPAGVELELRDLSLAGRILAAFPESLREDQRVPDTLAELGALARTPEANIVKLPNISASIPQLHDAIAELRAKGHAVPEYPEDPTSDAQREIQRRYDAVKGSAVNPVLRLGNSNRRAPSAVKEYARKHPPRLKPWRRDSRTHVSTMSAGDFRANERAVTLERATTARIEHVAVDGTRTCLREGLPLLADELLDATFMSRRALVAFLEREMRDAKEQGVLFSIHLKATMMKVSDPVLFGHALTGFFADVFREHGETLERLGIEPNNGLAEMLERIAELPAAEREPIEAAISRAIEEGPALAMVDSRRGITNLHVPSDVIIDASMPPLIRDGGKMWNAAGELQDVKAVIPDSSYAPLYEAMIEDCKTNGALDPTTMGTVPNVGLMALKAEEYGSHAKTFTMPADGTVRIVDADGTTLLEHEVEAGDVWRGCQTKDVAIRDWVALAVRRARATGWPAVFWLDESRAHDRELLAKVRRDLEALDTEGLVIECLPPREAMLYTLERVRRGENTISVTGNVLRDYLTDLFPILEVGTSAMMLSIVPLLAGGGLFETGAGGSAPKHVQQFVEEGHLRWNSLGEFLALTASLEHLAQHADNAGAALLGHTLEAAIGHHLEEGRGPSRACGELDNRGSHYWLARYWARELANQTEDAELAARFARVAVALEENEATILGELLAAQGAPVDLGGYYLPDDELADRAMRPSATLNGILAAV